eukprot:scpid93698/ scgid13137/ 
MTCTYRSITVYVLCCARTLNGSATFTFPHHMPSLHLTNPNVVSASAVFLELSFIQGKTVAFQDFYFPPCAPFFLISLKCRVAAFLFVVLPCRRRILFCAWTVQE